MTDVQQGFHFFLNSEKDNCNMALRLIGRLLSPYWRSSSFIDEGLEYLHEKENEKYKFAFMY